MIVNGYKDMKPFLPAVMLKGSPSIFDDALETAQDSLVTEILGVGLEARLEEQREEDAKLLKLCKRPCNRWQDQHCILIDTFIICPSRIPAADSVDSFSLIRIHTAFPIRRFLLPSL